MCIRDSASEVGCKVKFAVSHSYLHCLAAVTCFRYCPRPSSGNLPGRVIACNLLLESQLEASAQGRHAAQILQWLNAVRIQQSAASRPWTERSPALLIGRAWQGLLRHMRRFRTACFIGGDSIVAAAAVLVVHALVGPAETTLSPLQGTMLVLTSVLLAVGANICLRNYRLAWMTFSLRDVQRIAVAAGAAAAAFLLLALLAPHALPTGVTRIPSFPAVYAMTLFFGLTTLRGSRRLLFEPIILRRDGRRTLVVVSSRHAYFLPDVLRRLSGFKYRIIGILDPDSSRVGTHEQGLPVLGTTDDAEDIIAAHRIRTVMVLLGNHRDSPSPSHSRTNEDPRPFRLGEFYARLNRLGVEIKTMPSLVDLIEDRSDIGALDRLSIHELTGRPPVVVDTEAMHRQFHEQRVMVTGAGGSIGSELCRQLARFEPERLILFERDDSNLFSIDRELRSNYPDVRVLPFLGDVTRAQDLEEVFTREKPAVVFHAAAYKHVPILEFHPSEAVRVNALASYELARTAARHDTATLVYISTDKAVNPTSAMGASKRLGEMLVTAMGCNSAPPSTDRKNSMRVMAVRFGNVLDSRGSVSTIFRQAINRREPLTVTHRDMRRYLMLTSEAVLLLLRAATLGQGGEVFVLDMGDPVRIWDLANRMVELAGLRPNIDIPILVTGLRPGEKLFEELFLDDEHYQRTLHEKIFVSRNGTAPLVTLDAQIAQLLEAAQAGEVEEMLLQLRALVPESHLSLEQPEAAGD